MARSEVCELCGSSEDVNELASSIADTGNHMAPPQDVPLIDGNFYMPPGGGWIYYIKYNDIWYWNCEEEEIKLYLDKNINIINE